MERVLTGKPRRAGWPIDEQIGDGGDSPAWSRKRGSYQPPEPHRRRHEAPDVQRPASSVPYAELHTHSAYSFLDGASTPEELVEEAARLDLRAIALTDHDGLYGVVRFAEAAKELDVRTVFGAELSLGGGDRTEEPDPRGTAPAGACPWSRGVSTAVAPVGVGTSGRRRKGCPALRLRLAHRGSRWALAHPDRVPQRPCPSSAFRRRPGGRGKGAYRSGGPVRQRPGQHRAHPPRASPRR